MYKMQKNTLQLKKTLVKFAKVSYSYCAIQRKRNAILA